MKTLLLLILSAISVYADDIFAKDDLQKYLTKILLYKPGEVSVVTNFNAPGNRVAICCKNEQVVNENEMIRTETCVTNSNWPNKWDNVAYVEKTKEIGLLSDGCQIQLSVFIVSLLPEMKFDRYGCTHEQASRFVEIFKKQNGTFPKIGVIDLSTIKRIIFGKPAHWEIQTGDRLYGFRDDDGILTCTARGDL